MQLMPDVVLAIIPVNIIVELYEQSVLVVWLYFMVIFYGYISKIIVKSRQS